MTNKNEVNKSVFEDDIFSNEHDELDSGDYVGHDPYDPEPGEEDYIDDSEVVYEFTDEDDFEGQDEFSPSLETEEESLEYWEDDDHDAFSDDHTEMKEVDYDDGDEGADELDDLDDFDSDDDSFEDDENPFDDEEDADDEEDLFAMAKSKRTPHLPESEYPGVVGKVKVEKMPKGNFDKPWVRTTIPFQIKHPKTDEIITVPFFANKSTSKNSRLYPVIKGILGQVPQQEYSLKDLIGKKVYVVIEHREDETGDIWENVVQVRPLRSRKR
ncbi:hypothetical protein [Bacillus sp. SJS]|uniref:hypothetical protein n=1 Tax=Bacillus sp. SJS TaxID=1423321 RepID=UPI0004DCD638|nr:hypothetical protein [Bacillus sp. SJS]KZZ85048.1 hypothetical protein AS29_008345 [Bacillus sp. SJS]